MPNDIFRFELSRSEFYPEHKSAKDLEIGRRVCAGEALFVLSEEFRVGNSYLMAAAKRYLSHRLGWDNTAAMMRKHSAIGTELQIVRRLYEALPE